MAFTLHFGAFVFNSLLPIIHKHKGTDHAPQAWVTQDSSSVLDYKHRKSTIHSTYLTWAIFIYCTTLLS